MKKENINYKNISEFTPQDTIYIPYTYSQGYSPHLILCQFISCEIGKVKGKAIAYPEQENKSWPNYDKQIADGWELSAKLTSCKLYGKAVNDRYSSWYPFDAVGFAAYENEAKKKELMPETDESYGIARFSRRQGSSKPMFGSSIKHRSIITLTISNGSITRDLNSERYSSTGIPIIEVEMSESQFAQLITSFNSGEGTPVTITQKEGRLIHDCPFISKAEVFQAEFKHEMESLSVKLEKLTAQAQTILSNPKGVNKSERDLILKSIQSLRQTITDRVPWVAEQFNEQMQKTVSEAKAEVEAFIQVRAKENNINIDGNKSPLEIE